MAENFREEFVAQRGQRHGSARVAGVGGLNGIHGKRTDGIDTEKIEVRSRHDPKDNGL